MELSEAAATKRQRAGHPENHISPLRPHFSPSVPLDPPNAAYPHPYHAYPRPSGPPAPREDNGHAPPDQRDAYAYPPERYARPTTPLGQSGHFPQDPKYSRPSHPPSHPGSAGDPYRVKSEERRSSMDGQYHQHAQHPAPYYPPPLHHQHPHRPSQAAHLPDINTNGLPMDQHGGAGYPYSAPPHMSAQGPSESLHGYNGSSGGQGPGSAQRRPKAQRAQQACDNCRLRKARCDEGRPDCGNCTDTGQTCTYRDVPPPKSDRTMNEVSKKLDNVIDGLEDLRAEVRAELQSVKQQSFAQYSQHSRSGHGSGDGSSMHRSSQPPTSYPAHAYHTAHGMQLDSPSDDPSARAQTYISNSGAGQHYEAIPPRLDARLREEEVAAINSGELAIPMEHTTAAHKLSKWASISQFFKGIVIGDDYVMEQEEKRGLLRLYGRGEGNGRDDEGQVPLKQYRQTKPIYLPGSPSPIIRPIKEDLPFHQPPLGSSPDGSWGVAFDRASQSDSGHLRSASNVGGLGANGYLLLDEGTVRHLYKSYLDNIHIIQPFLNKATTDQRIERFISLYCPANTRSFVATNQGTDESNRNDSTVYQKAAKRKRSEEPIQDAAATNGERTKTPLPERSISNAIVLFIMALGKISLHKAPLPSWTKFSDFDARSPRSNNTDSPPFRSPIPSNTPRSASAPIDPDRPAFPVPMERRPSQNSGSNDRRETRPKNVDIIPGLAYYSYAASILGELFGGTELIHMHANMLAGLYNAQLIRVFDSWKFINQACVICLLLLNRARNRGIDLSTHPSERKEGQRTTFEQNQLVIGFWTCLQLESDILAELDELPHSGVSMMEGSVMLPPSEAIYSADLPNSATVTACWLSQIHLRKILNRAHTALYNTANNNKKKSAWTFSRAEDLVSSLGEWRLSLPRELKWDDGDPPSKDINSARLRGKYYGACYIVHRPFLHRVLEPSNNMGPLNTFSNWKAHTDNHEGSSSQSDYAGSQNTHEHGQPRKDLTPAQQENQYCLEMSEKCIAAACHSTTAFDGILFDDDRQIRRLVVTNLFGTASAQFGNMLVLAAAYLGGTTSYLVANHPFQALMDRTLKLLSNLALLSPTFKINHEILEKANNLLSTYRKGEPLAQGGTPLATPTSTVSSFGRPG